MRSEDFTLVFWEASRQRRALYLFFKKIFLVEEEDDGSLCEPLVVANRIKQLHRFVHAILKERLRLEHCKALWDGSIEC